MMSVFTRRRDTEEVELTISARTFFKVLLLILVTTLVLAALARATYALTLITIALFLALALNGPVSWLAQHFPGPLRGSRSTATALAFFIVIALLGAFLAYLVPQAVRQTQSLLNNAPHIVQDLQNQNNGVNRFIARYHLQGQIDQVTAELSDKLRTSSSSAITAVSEILNSIVSMLTILALTFMMLIEGPGWLRFANALVPERHRNHAEKLRHNMYRAVRGYVNGQVALAAIAALLVFPGLLIFNVGYPFALVAVVFICALIPMVGNIIGAIIISFVALFHSPFSALGILVYYILYQQVETYAIQPRLQSNTTNLSPLIVLMSLIIGLSFGGLLGGLVAIPIAACLRVWLIDHLQHKYDVDTSTMPGGKD